MFSRLFFCNILVILVLYFMIIDAQNCNGRPPVRVNPKDCCTFPKFVNKGNCNEGGGRRGGGKCKVECMFTNAGLYSNGTVNQAQLTTSFTNSVNGDAGLTSALKSVIPKCFTLANTRSAEFTQKYSSNPSNCHPISSFLMRCIKRGLVAECPANLSNPSPDCTTLKSYFVTCPA